MMAPAISPVLPLMYHAFPGIKQEGVEMLSTIPNIGIVLGLAISPFLIRLIGQKPTIVTGLLITLATGTFPMYAKEYSLILISRFFVGVGIGLFNSLAVSLIPEFYRNDENKLATMVGWQNVMGPVGMALASFAISYLSTISWHAAFAIYFIVIPILILFTLVVPLPKVDRKSVKAEKKPREKQHLNKKVVLIAGLMFLLFIFNMPVSFKFPAFFVEQHIGTVSQYSGMTGILGLVGIPIGMAFGLIFKKLHDKVLPMGALLAVIGIVILCISTNIFLFGLGYFIFTAGFGFVTPYMYNWLDWVAPENSVNLATTLVLIMINIGCAVSPIILNSITSSAKGIVTLMVIFYSCFAVYAIIHYLRVHRKAVVSAKK